MMGSGANSGSSPVFNPRPATTYYLASSSPNNNNNGEQAQTYFIERQASTHRNLSKLGNKSSSNKNKSERSRLVKSMSSSGSLKPSPSNGSLASSSIGGMNPLLTSSDRTFYGSTASSLDRPEDLYTIRFQVLIWNIGKLDVVTASVPMTFRVTLFWNDIDTEVVDRDDVSEDGSLISSSSKSVNIWRMHGRQKAIQHEIRDTPQGGMMEIPPLAIMNCSTFETIGAPEVDMLRESSRLMRWSCMYRATMIQENLRVDQFPHDDHDIYIQLAILSHRGKGKQWDRRLWKLALATADDAQNTTRIPHGVLVDQARLPGFSYNKERGLEFKFCTLEHGAFDKHIEESHDEYLKVSLNVLRESGYYDKNIVPLLALMNVVGVSVLTFKDTEFFYRALITLNIAFVEMSIRMTADSHLPSVGYEIRLQSVLNQFFFVLMALVLEAMAVYVLSTSYNASLALTRNIDWTTGGLALFHNFFTVFTYYRSKRRARRRLHHGWKQETDGVGK